MGVVYPHRERNSNIAGKILIVPIVSVANVSQLAVDLLIASLSLKCVATLDPSYFIPVVGGRDDGEPGITTPFELYTNDIVNIAVIQQRSPVLKSRKQEFADALITFIKNSGVSAVLFLSGVDVSDRTDSQMFTPTHQIQPTGPSLATSPLQKLNSLPIPTYTTPVSQHPRTGDGATPIPFIPGGGLTRRILTSLTQNWSIPTAALLQFVLEGDNREDAHLLAAVVAKALGVDHAISEWKRPGSWEQGLFGTPHEQTLYG
ncbi:PAC2 family-domain-containing protein [Amanita rubescens]|nr:PAC2 family-domain-containing protein [Amanita rubescens]